MFVAARFKTTEVLFASVPNNPLVYGYISPYLYIGIMTDRASKAFATRAIRAF
jgi:hypothetical protein